MFLWNENNSAIKKLNLTSILEYMGVSKEIIEGAHDAGFDCEASAEILIKLLRAERYLTKKDPSTGKRRLEMSNCMAEWRYNDEVKS